MRKLFAVAVFILMLTAGSAMAADGFYIGAFVPNEKVTGGAGAGIASGTGWGVRAGFGFSRYVAIEANYGTTKHDVSPTLTSLPFSTSSIDLNILAADIKLSFPLTSLDSAQVMTLVPYAIVGYDLYEFQDHSTIQFKNKDVQWGVGIELYLFREMSVEAGWTWTKIVLPMMVSIGPGAFIQETGGDAERVDIGLIYHF